MKKDLVCIKKILKTVGGTKHFQEIPRVEGARNFWAYWENSGARNISGFLERGYETFSLCPKGGYETFSVVQKNFTRPGMQHKK